MWHGEDGVDLTWTHSETAASAEVKNIGKR